MVRFHLSRHLTRHSPPICKRTALFSPRTTCPFKHPLRIVPSHQRSLSNTFLFLYFYQNKIHQTKEQQIIANCLLDCRLLKRCLYILFIIS